MDTLVLLLEHGLFWQRKQAHWRIHSIVGMGGPLFGREEKTGHREPSPTGPLTNKFCQDLNIRRDSPENSFAFVAVGSNLAASKTVLRAVPSLH